jgi:AcrR family transcriptional regulator
VIFIYNLKTVKEKASEWGITPRHVQLLCREGKINGAVKRAGAWFIPHNAINYAQNKKSAGKPFKFAGTKKKIFDSAITLFTQNGYENVSINDIADIIGLRQSAVYNHFKSKYDILDTIYNFYCYYSLSNRPSTGALKPLLKTGSLLEIILKGFRYEFDAEILGHMADITKIIIQRAATDKRAAEIFQTLLLEEGVRFVEESLNNAIKTGKSTPFDTHAAAVLINSVRLYTFLWRLVDPPHKLYMNMLKDEQTMYKYIAAFFSDSPAD